MTKRLGGRESMDDRQILEEATQLSSQYSKVSSGSANNHTAWLDGVCALERKFIQAIAVNEITNPTVCAKALATLGGQATHLETAEPALTR